MQTMDYSSASDVSDLPSVAVRRGSEPPAFNITSGRSITTSACSEVTWDAYDTSISVRADETVEVGDFSHYAASLLGRDWWQALDVLPHELRNHLHLTVQHVRTLLGVRRKLHIKPGEKRGISYCLVYDAMQDDYLYGVATILALYRERMTSGLLVLPCDHDVPSRARQNTRLSVTPDSCKILYFTDDWEPFRECCWLYGHHRCV